MLVATYQRVSTDGQVGGDRFGLPAQLEAIKDFAERNGYEIIANFEDAGFSGSTMQRPGLQNVLLSAGQLPFRAVLVAKMDRIARDLMAQLWIEKELMKNNVEIISVAEPFRGRDSANVLFRQIIGAFSQFERDRITERMTGGRQQKARSGGYSGGSPAYGYKSSRGSKTLQIDNNKVESVRKIFELHREDPNLTLREIADILNQDGHTTAQGKAFHAMQVKRVLDREGFYLGNYFYAGIESKGQHRSIIDTR